MKRKYRFGRRGTDEWSKPLDRGPVLDRLEKRHADLLGRPVYFGKRSGTAQEVTWQKKPRSWSEAKALLREGMSSGEVGDILFVRFGPTGSAPTYRVRIVRIQVPGGKVPDAGGNQIVERMREFTYGTGNYPDAEDWGTVNNRQMRQGGGASEHCEFNSTVATGPDGERDWGRGGNATDVHFDDFERQMQHSRDLQETFGWRVNIVDATDNDLHRDHNHCQGEDDHPSWMVPVGLGGSA